MTPQWSLYLLVQSVVNLSVSCRIQYCVPLSVSLSCSACMDLFAFAAVFAEGDIDLEISQKLCFIYVLLLRLSELHHPRSGCKVLCKKNSINIAILCLFKFPATICLIPCELAERELYEYRAQEIKGECKHPCRTYREF